MAARRSMALSPRHRDAIKTAMLINRLQGFALGGNCPQSGRPIQMSKEQVAAALGLLRKTLPDLAGTTLEAGPGLVGGFVMYGAIEAPSVEAWSADNPPPAGA